MDVPSKSSRKRRALPPVSKATGGPMPSIDISDGSALQEMDDLEYAERLKSFGGPSVTDGGGLEPDHGIGEDR